MKNYPSNLFETQTMNCYFYQRYREIKNFVGDKSKRLTSKTFLDDRFTLLNHSKLHLGYTDVQFVYKRLLLFGECKIFFKHFNENVIIANKPDNHIASFIGMFIKRLINAESKDFDWEIQGIIYDMESIFGTVESQYIDLLIQSFSQLETK